jgi:predicted transglutaminase-like protease
MYEYDASIQIEAKISQPHYFHIYSTKMYQECCDNIHCA